ncbi:Crp/Fnr family transcriptional regulator [Fodinicurvata fenggangensis]|uniref:Crp/Fnr family transcriptional regulator n=1 Tax=Fodinicurvata fenggangensis TaxID=1121830 RepID=UPI0012DE4726|nr:Crp/Fnr family transcriptional regulator [Fodinicurvata fenggangensis]
MSEPSPSGSEKIAHEEETPCRSCKVGRLGFCRFFKDVLPDAPAPFYMGRQSFLRRRTLYTQSSSIKHIHVVREGWAFRYMLSQDGRRQILSYQLPGEIISPSFLFSSQPQFAGQSLTKLETCVFDVELIRRECQQDPSFLDHVIATCLSEKEDYEMRLFELGRCRAEERLARLILYLESKQESMDLKANDRIQFPLTQQDIADTLGLTQVHVSRVLREFRERELILSRQGFLEIKDANALRELATGSL